MLNKLKLILETVPLEELNEFYTYLYGKNSYDRKSVETHILNYFIQYLYLHKRSNKCEIKCYAMLSWFSSMFERYMDNVN